MEKEEEEPAQPLLIQRQAAEEEEPEEEPAQPLLVQRQAAEEEEPEEEPSQPLLVQRQAAEEEEPEEEPSQPLLVQRQAAEEEEPEEEPAQPLLVQRRADIVQAECASCGTGDTEEEQVLQRKPRKKRDNGRFSAGNDVSSYLQKPRGNGKSLDAPTRSRMQSAFGADLGDVRVHTSSESARLNQDMGAHAFTHGADIYFNTGEYDPHSARGERLLAHELTHAVQQGAIFGTDDGNGRGSLIQRDGDCEAEEEEGGSEEAAEEASTTPTPGTGECIESNPPAEEPPEGTEEPEEEETPAEIEARESAPVDDRQANAPPPNENAPEGEEGIAEAGDETEEAPQDPCAVREAAGGDVAEIGAQTGPAAEGGGAGAAPVSAPAVESGGAGAGPAATEAPTGGEREGESEAGAEEQEGGENAFLDQVISASAAAVQPATGEAASPGVLAELDRETTSSEQASDDLDKTSEMLTEMTARDLAFLKPAGERALVNHQEDANAMANAFLVGAGQQLDVFIGQGRAAAASLRAGTAEKKAALQAEIQRHHANTQALFGQLRASAQAQAQVATEQIEARHLEVLAAIDERALAAQEQIPPLYDAQVERLEQARTDQLVRLDEVYQTGHDDLVQIGRDMGSQAVDRARQHERAYRNADNAPADVQRRVRNNEPDESFWDGYLTYNRYMARADATQEVGEQYREGFETEAQAQADNMMCGKPRDVEIIHLIVGQSMESLGCARDNALDSIETQRQSAIAMAEQARQRAIGTLETSLQATLAQFDERKAGQLALIDSYGARQEMAIERDSERAVSAVLQGVSDAASRVVRYLGQFRDQVESTEAPAPEDLSEMMMAEEAQLVSSFESAQAALDQVVAQAQTSLDAGQAQVLTALEQLYQKGAGEAYLLADGFEQATLDLIAGTMSGYDQTMASFEENLAANLDNSIQVLEGVVTGAIGVLEQINSGVEGRFQESGTQMEQGMQNTLDEKLDQKVCAEAEKAAADVQPWWKTALKVLLIIAVIVVVAVVLGPAIIGAVGAAATALAGSLGAGAALAGTIGAWVGPIIGGAIVGAIAGAAIQVGSNAIYGRPLGEGVWQAVIAGAIGGALGGVGGQLGQVLVGRFAATAFSRIAIQYGTDMAFDVVGGILGDLAAGNPITWESIVMGLAIGGAVQISMGGLGGLAARSRGARAAARGAPAGPAAPGARAAAPEAPATAPGARAAAEPAEGLVGRLARGRLGRAAERITDIQGRAMAAGERFGTRVGGVGARAPTAEATSAALGFARQRVEGGEFFPTRSGHEPVGWRGPDSRPPVGSILSEMPVTLGGTRHTLKQIEYADGPRYILCSWCEPVLSRIRGLMDAEPDVTIRNRLQELHERVERIDLSESRFPDYDTRVNNMNAMMRILAEVDNIVPGSVYGPPVAPGRARAGIFDDLPQTPLIRRAMELFSGNRQALRDYLRNLIPAPGGPQRTAFQRLLNQAIEAQAQGRALKQAQEQVQGPPARLDPGAPARLDIDQGVDFPFGFYDRSGFESFSRQLYSTISGDDVQLILTGSSVTGRRFQRVGVEGYTDAPFNVGGSSPKHRGLSDYDVAIVSRGLYDEAVSRGDIQIVDNATFVLTPAQLQRLGLGTLHTRAQRAIMAETGLPHDVNFKIYDPDAGWVPNRPHLLLPR